MLGRETRNQFSITRLNCPNDRIPVQRAPGGALPNASMFPTSFGG
jgi:hypothetical protein